MQLYHLNFIRQIYPTMSESLADISNSSEIKICILYQVLDIGAAYNYGQEGERGDKHLL